MIHYQVATPREDLHQILNLQQQNLSKNISRTEAKAQGFVTIEHDYDTLEAMNAAVPHIIAKENDEVVGYALVMLEKFKHRVPILIPMFDRVNQLSWEGHAVSEMKYFVMGQICIEKSWRGKGVFSGLYQHMKNVMYTEFDGVITEIATRNTRSMRAHEKVGFEILDIYQTEKEEWAIVGWMF